MTSEEILDLSQSPEFNPALPEEGTSRQTIFDSNVPYKMKDRFRRAPSVEVDQSKWK